MINKAMQETWGKIRLAVHWQEQLQWGVFGSLDERQGGLDKAQGHDKDDWDGLEVVEGVQQVNEAHKIKITGNVQAAITDASKGSHDEIKLILICVQ